MITEDDRDDFKGIAETCYYRDCTAPITGASDYCSKEHEAKGTNPLGIKEWIIDIYDVNLEVMPTSLVYVGIQKHLDGVIEYLTNHGLKVEAEEVARS